MASFGTGQSKYKLMWQVELTIMLTKANMELEKSASHGCYQKVVKKLSRLIKNLCTSGNGMMNSTVKLTVLQWLSHQSQYLILCSEIKPFPTSFQGCSRREGSAENTLANRVASQLHSQGLLGFQNGSLEKILANSRSRDLITKACYQFETIKICNIFGDTWPAVCQCLLQATILNTEKSLGTRLANSRPCVFKNIGDFVCFKRANLWTSDLLFARVFPCSSPGDKVGWPIYSVLKCFEEC